jgi:ubiquinone/menaquinone biosynthesis C-methylase UbiE
MTAERRATQEFFATRAGNWDTRFAGDDEKYAAVARELDPPVGAVVLDAGCGTARASAAFADVIGVDGCLVNLDVTLEMLVAARLAGRPGSFGIADATELPLRTSSVDVVLAAGLIPHLSDPAAGLRELARVTKLGGRLAVFHPISRVALAARHAQVPSDDDAIAPARLVPMLVACGWEPTLVDDSDNRFCVIASRSS